MRIVTPQEMKELEAISREKYQFDDKLIIENVGLLGAERIVHKLGDDLFNVEIIFFIGNGNNGADGLSLARHMMKFGVKPRAFLLFDEKQSSVELGYQLKKARAFGVKVHVATDVADVESYFSQVAGPKVIVDAIFGTGRGFRVIKFLSRAPVAGLLFNVMVMVAHIPDVVNRSVSNGPLHYSLHVLLIVTSLLMWMPVCGPERSFRLQYGGMMIYLFLMSVVPTVPAAWLTFAEGSVYKHYDIPVRVWGLSVTTDQQLAGAVMKSAGSMFLWTIIVVIFFRRFIGRFFAEASYSKNSSQV